MINACWIHLHDFFKLFSRSTLKGFHKYVMILFSEAGFVKKFYPFDFFVIFGVQYVVAYFPGERLPPRFCQAANNLHLVKQLAASQACNKQIRMPIFDKELCSCNFE